MQKRKDLLVLIGLMIAGCIYAILSSKVYLGRNLFGGIVFLIPPVVYLGYRSKKPWKKILLSTFLFGLLFGFFFEFLQEFNHAYTFAQSVMPTLFGFLSLDFIIWHMMFALLVFTFYEHFIASKYKPRSDRVLSTFWPILIATTLAISLALAFYYLQPSLLTINYAYTYYGVLAILPVSVLLLEHQDLWRDSFLIVMFFFAMYFVIELIAVRNNWWTYPGHYIGWIHLGFVSFPIEEILFWMLCYPMVLIVYYQVFISGIYFKKDLK